MRGFQTGSAYVLVKPNLRGWDRTVRDGVTADAPAAGREAGSRIGGAMVSALKVSLAAVGAAAVVIGGAALKGGLDRLLNIEDAQAKMRALGYTAVEVDGIMDSALKSVKGTAFGLGEAATTAANAVAAGIEPGKELTKYLTMTASAATLAGTSMEDMGSIVNKVNTTGKVYTDNLNQLADRGIPIFQWLAKEYGVTQEELSKMVRSGKVDAETFNRVLSENVGDAAVIAADTTRGAFLNMKASLSRVGANLLEGVFPMFKKGFLQLTKWLGPLEDKAKVVGKALGRDLAQAAKIAQGAFQWLFQGKRSNALDDMAASGKPIYAWLTKIRDVATGTWSTLTGGISAFRAAWKHSESEVTSSGLPGVFERIGSYARKAFDWIRKDALPAVRDLFKQGDTSGLANSFSAIGDSVVKLAPAFGDFIRQMPSFNDLLSVGATVMGFLADNVDTLRKWMPALVAGFIAYKGAQVATNLLGRNSALGMGMQLLATRALIISNRQLAAVQMQVAIASGRANTVEATGTVTKSRSTIATIAKTAADKVAIVATKAWTIAQRALNFVLSNNPIGWLIKGLVLLGGALVLAYNTSDEFRAVVNKAWAGVRAAAGAVVDWFVGTAWPWLQQVFTWIGQKATDLWTSYVKPAFEGIGRGIGSVVMWLLNTGWPILKQTFSWIGEKAVWLWTSVYKPYFGFILGLVKTVFGWVLNTGWPWLQKAFSWVGEKATWLWKTAISPAFDGIWGTVKTVFGWVKDTGWPWLRDALQKVGNKATWLWKEIITPAFDGIKAVISDAWDGAKTIFDKFKGGLDSLKDRFQTVKDGIATIWGAVTSVIATPINGAISLFNGFLNGLQKAVNLIPGVNFSGTWGSIAPVTVRRAPHKGDTGPRGRIGGLAGGGIVPGPWLGPRADNVLGIDDRGVPTARVNPREMVLSVAGTSKLLRKVGMTGLNMLNRGELPGFAGGGLIGARTGGGLGDIWDAVVGGGKKVIDFFRDPLGALKNIASGLLAGIGNSWPAKIASGVGMDMLGGLGARIKDLMFGGEEPGGPVGKGMGWRSIWAIIKGLVPDAVMTSNQRGSGSKTASGYTSFHGLGRAVDWVSRNMSAAWRTIASAGIPWTEHYHSGRGAGFMRRGRMVSRSQIAPVTIANHWDHGHTAYADGGLVPDMIQDGPKLYDQGGPLPPGDTWVRNATGSTEWVLPPGAGQSALVGKVEISGMTRDNSTKVLDDLEWRLRQIRMNTSTLARG